MPTSKPVPFAEHDGPNQLATFVSISTPQGPGGAPTHSAPQANTALATTSVVEGSLTLRRSVSSSLLNHAQHHHGGAVIASGIAVEDHLIAGRYRVDSILGSGSWGEVVRGFDMATQTPVAVKLTRSHPNAVDALRSELRVYQAISLFRGRDLLALPESGPVLAPSRVLADPPPPGNKSNSREAVAGDEARPAPSSSPPARPLRNLPPADDASSVPLTIFASNNIIGLPTVLHFEVVTQAPLPASPAALVSAAESSATGGGPSGQSSPSPATAAPAQRTKGYLVMSMLGLSLETLRLYCFGSFDEPTILMLGDQLVGRLEHVHRCGFVHQDLKPDNFMMGAGPTAHIVHLIDFGLAQCYREGLEERLMLEPETVPSAEIDAAPHTPRTLVGVVGTQVFASADAMKGYRQSRRDDLQALLHCLVYLATGRLPWSEPYEPSVAMKLKSSLSTAELCVECPYLLDFANMVKALGYEEKPAYGVMRGVLRRQLLLDGFSYDFNYSWIKKRVDELSSAAAAVSRRSDNANTSAMASTSVA